MCRLFEPAIYLRSNSLGDYEPSEGTSRTAALWQCLNSARDFFSAFLVIPPQNLACMPFLSVQLSFGVLTVTRLLCLGDDGADGSAGNSDWNSSLAREAVNLDAIYTRLADFFDEADKICIGLGRRVRYLNQERSVLAMYRDKIRWLRNWYVGRARSGAQASSYPTFPSYRAENDQDRERGADCASGGGATSKDGIRDHLGPGGGLHSSSSSSNNSNSNSAAGGSSIPAAHGQPMDVDYAGVSSVHAAAAAAGMPGDLDDGFWQAMFDWGWNGGLDMMEVQG